MTRRLITLVGVAACLSVLSLPARASAAPSFFDSVVMGTAPLAPSLSAMERAEVPRRDVLRCLFGARRDLENRLMDRSQAGDHSVSFQQVARERDRVVTTINRIIAASFQALTFSPDDAIAPDGLATAKACASTAIVNPASDAPLLESPGVASRLERPPGWVRAADARLRPERRC